jgi:hypothetical protein
MPCTVVTKRGRVPVHAAPGQNAIMRHTRTRMDDVDFLFQQKLAQPADEQQRFERFFADRPGKMLGARCNERHDLSPARRHHQRAVAMLDQCLGYFERAAFHPAGFECREQLRTVSFFFIHSSFYLELSI